MRKYLICLLSFFLLLVGCTVPEKPKEPIDDPGENGTEDPEDPIDDPSVPGEPGDSDNYVVTSIWTGLRNTIMTKR